MLGRNIFMKLVSKIRCELKLQLQLQLQLLITQSEYVLAIYSLHSFHQYVCGLAPDTSSSLINSAFNCIVIALMLADPHALKVNILLLFNIYRSNIPIDTGEETQSLSTSHCFVATSSSF